MDHNRSRVFLVVEAVIAHAMTTSKRAWANCNAGMRKQVSEDCLMHQNSGENGDNSRRLARSDRYARSLPSSPRKPLSRCKFVSARCFTCVKGARRFVRTDSYEALAKQRQDFGRCSSKRLPTEAASSRASSASPIVVSSLQGSAFYSPQQNVDSIL